MSRVRLPATYQALAIVFDHEGDSSIERLQNCALIAFGFDTSDRGPDAIRERLTEYVIGQIVLTKEEVVNFLEYARTYSRDVPGSRPWPEKFKRLKACGLLEYLGLSENSVS